MLRTAAAILLAACTSFAVACGGGNEDDGDASPTVLATPGTVQPGPADDLREIRIELTGGDLFPGPSNFVFGILDENGQPQGGATVTVTFYDVSDPQKPRDVGTFDAIESAPGVGDVVEHRHENGEIHNHGGQDDDRVVYFVPVTFPHAGSWGAIIKATLRDGSKGVGNPGFFVGEAPRYPAPGEKANASDNLTAADVGDIRQIDSGDPPNDMHDVKIKDAIAAGRPVVVVFSTPAFCTSQFCGPVNEEIESLQQDYKDDVDFVHIEIWFDFEKQTLNPTTIEWLQQPDGGLSEPWVFVIDKEGNIYDRWEGAASRVVVEPAVKAVAAGETYAQKAAPPVLE
jgi:hypothetical protein